MSEDKPDILEDAAWEIQHFDRVSARTSAIMAEEINELRFEVRRLNVMLTGERDLIKILTQNLEKKL